MQHAWRIFCAAGPAPCRFAYRTLDYGEVRHFSEQGGRRDGDPGWIAR